MEAQDRGNLEWRREEVDPGPDSREAQGEEEEDRGIGQGKDDEEGPCLALGQLVLELGHEDARGEDDEVGPDDLGRVAAEAADHAGGEEPDHGENRGPEGCHEEAARDEGGPGRRPRDEALAEGDEEPGEEADLHVLEH